MRSYPRFTCRAAILVTAFALPGLHAAAEPVGKFALVSDIHFDPFDPAGLAKTLAVTDAEDWMAQFAALPAGPASQYGKDTNHILLTSTLAELKKSLAEADFSIITGDFLSHGFQEDTAKALGVAEGSETVQAFAERTTIFVADALDAALPDKPIFMAIGNNDSDCGDYEIEPGGDYLAATRETVRRLAGAGLVAPDFDDTYAAGGYYAAHHPTLPNTLIIVLNDVLWSQRYQNACGSDGLAPAEAEMDWVAAKLAAQKAAGGKVWFAHHIPWGMDPYSIEHSKADTCAGKVVPLLKDEFSTPFLALIAQYADIIDVSLSGHIHFDDYRLLTDADGNAIETDKVVPAISPIFGQNPGFEMFSYDVKSGAPTDFTTTNLSNLPALSSTVAGDWREEYTFSKAYGLAGYSVESVAALWKGLNEAGPMRDTYLNLYNVGKGTLSADNLAGYACAVGHLDTESYTTCYCGG